MIVPAAKAFLYRHVLYGMLLEEVELSMTEGFLSLPLGCDGVPDEAETKYIARETGF